MPWLEVRRGAWQMIWVPLQCYRTPNCFGFGLGGGVVVFFIRLLFSTLTCFRQDWGNHVESQLHETV